MKNRIATINKEDNAHEWKNSRLREEKERLSVRKIREITESRESTIFIALGWLAKEGKVKLVEKGGMLYAEKNALAPETYY